MKKKMWILLLVLGLLPFVIVIAGGINASINGFGELSMNPIYGFEAFMDWFILWSYVYWPSYVLGLGLIIGSLIVRKRM